MRVSRGLEAQCDCPPSPGAEQPFDEVLDEVVSYMGPIASAVCGTPAPEFLQYPSRFGRKSTTSGRKAMTRVSASMRTR